jgi:hypothetical protein
MQIALALLSENGIIPKPGVFFQPSERSRVMTPVENRSYAPKYITWQ